MTYFHSDGSGQHMKDYGTKIRIKCNKPLSRKKRTLDEETCANWQTVDSFGVRIIEWSKYDDQWDDEVVRFYEPLTEFRYTLTSGSGLMAASNRNQTKVRFKKPK